MNELTRIFNDFNIIFSGGEIQQCKHENKTVVKSCCGQKLTESEYNYCFFCAERFYPIEVCKDCGEEL